MIKSFIFLLFAAQIFSGGIMAADSKEVIPPGAVMVTEREVISVNDQSVKESSGYQVQQPNGKKPIRVGKWSVTVGKLKLQEMNYNNHGDKDGEETMYYPDGKIFTIQPYKAGKLEGQSRTFSMTGQLMSTSEYHAGKKNGEYREFDAFGKSSKIVVFKDDEEVQAK